MTPGVKLQTCNSKDRAIANTVNTLFPIHPVQSEREFGDLGPV